MPARLLPQEGRPEPGELGARRLVYAAVVLGVLALFALLFS